MKAAAIFAAVWVMGGVAGKEGAPPLFSAGRDPTADLGGRSLLRPREQRLTIENDDEPNEELRVRFRLGRVRTSVAATC